MVFENEDMFKNFTSDAPLTWPWFRKVEKAKLSLSSKREEREINVKLLTPVELVYNGSLTNNDLLSGSLKAFIG